MMHVDVLFSGVAVTDLERSAEWYARLLGRPHDITVNEDEVMWQIVLKGWLYLVTDPSRAGNCFFSLAVADLSSALRDTARRGVDSPPVEQVQTAGWKATFTDPDGNQIALIEVVTASRD